MRRLKSSLLLYMVASRRRGDGYKSLCAVKFGYCRLATTQEMENIGNKKNIRIHEAVTEHGQTSFRT